MTEQKYLCGRHGVYEGASCWECDSEVAHDNKIRADTFEEAAKMLAWLAEHGTMPQAVEQAIKDFRAKARETA